MIPKDFASPPVRFRPAPFWWWVGETLDRERLLWQLDELKRQGIGGAVIGYSHLPDGRNDPGDPPVFSGAWWDLLRWLIGECRKREMILGFQDYTLINPLLAEIGRDRSDMAGGQLGETHGIARAGAPVELVCPDGCRPVAAAGYSRSGGKVASSPPVELSGRMQGDRLTWAPESGECLVSLVWRRPVPFDPMHPAAGPAVIERLYAPFERECPGEVGKTLAIFFQDELDFGLRLPMWSDRLPEAFASAHGYDVRECLPALWHDLGPRTPKLRVDYADAVTRLLESSYFIPVYRWHEERGTLFGNDNAGRGAIGTGRRYYGDYFRTMRWYSAPGTDDPQLRNPRAFAGLKVNSSIAQLYRRPRVWVEAFHSSGWGATPAEIVSGLNEDFLLGANFVNLHGLYYTTFGSWWEWAAPDFHFRQPYWAAAGSMNDYLARLCALLSQGVHACDTAILYPVTALEGGLNGGVGAEAGLAVSLSEQQRGEAETLDPAEAIAFRLGRALVDAGEDFDFIDFESLERAEAKNGVLAVAGGAYRSLVLPMMSTLRWSALCRARDFYRAGGRVIAAGCLPRASDRKGADDPEGAEIVAELFGAAPGRTGGVRRNAAGGEAIFAAGVEGALRALRAAGPPDFAPAGAPLQALHRRVGGLEVYFVRNPLASPVTAAAIFRAQGRVERWDAWTGGAAVQASETGASGGTRIELDLAAGEAQVMVFDPSRPALPASPRPRAACEVRTLPHEGWEFELEPTLDNRHGDFRLPATRELLGAEARLFRFREEQPGDKGLERPDWDDSSWPVVAATYGPRFWKLGPLPPDVAGAAMEEALRRASPIDPGAPVAIGGRNYTWEPYAFSREWGIEGDPFLLDWRSGPHGLKKKVPDEFIDLDGAVPGSTWYLWSSLDAGTGTDAASLVAGSRAAFTVWLNGEPVLRRAEALPAGAHPAWNLPHYDSEPLRASVCLRSGHNPLLVRLRQPADQRVRAYVALDAPPVMDRPALRWFAAAPAWGFNPRPADHRHAGWYRFLAPPGLASFRVRVRGELSAWADGASLQAKGSPETAGSSDYAVTLPGPAAGPVAIALRVQQRPDSFGGDSLAGPVRMTCRPGRIALGDWSAQGLAAYSGAAWYRRTVELDGADIGCPLELDLGEVRATGEVWWNGVQVGQRVAPPWRFDLGGRSRPGANRLEVKVANTLANHYAGIPTPYFHPEQTVSGLLGPVRILGRPV